eukprot:TRINITY_DN3826_c0_g1_i1.p1 TRINITY_DN3826_c0_g1~~TRINITY_DN3826_c0_g1_i1.p1  ORF type:complete len:1333 (-),score=278.45 TRINITY_DN3826_c0_g1_i1:76-4074(-)
MKAVWVLITLFTILLSHTTCQDIEFWASLPVTSSDAYTALLTKQLIAGVELGFKFANLASQTGVLRTYNITFRVVDDQDNYTKFQENLNMIVNNQTNALGLLFSSSTERAIYTQNLLNNTFPFINPISSSSVLRTPSARNIINVRPSNRAEVYGLLSSLRNVYNVQRISFLFSANDSDALEAYSNIRYYTSLLGLSLVSFANTTNDPNATQSAIGNIAVGNPAAVIFWSYAAQYTENWLQEAVNQLPPGVIYASNYAGYLDNFKFNRINGSLSFSVPAPIYTTSFMPLLPNQNFSFIPQWYANLDTLTPEEYLIARSPKGLEAYFTAKIIAQNLGRIYKPTVSRDLFLSQFYKTPLTAVGDFPLGPISDDDSPFSVFQPCNDLAHSLVLFRMWNNSVTLVQNSSVSWQGCAPTNNLLKPINFGSVYNPNDTQAIQTLDGIDAAFSVINKDTTRRGLAPLQLIRLPISPTTSYLEATQTLVDLYNVTALASYSEEAALPVRDYIKKEGITLVDVISSSIRFRDGLNPYIVNIRVGVQQQVLNSLYYLLSVKGAVNGRINIGIYYHTDPSGYEFIDNINDALASFDNFNQNGAPIPVPSSVNNTINGTNKLNVVFAVSSIAVGENGGINNTFLSLADRIQASPIDYMLISSRENESYVVQIISLINSLQPDAPPITDLGANGNLTTFNHMRVLLHANRNIVNTNKVAAANGVNNVILMSSNYPAASTNTASFNNAINLVAEYASTQPEKNYNNYNEPGLGGFMTGKFLSIVVADVNGEVNASTFYSTIYSTSSYNLNGFRLGPYSLAHDKTDGCNSGPRSVALVRPLLNVFGFQSITSRFFWNPCLAVPPVLDLEGLVTKESSDRTTIIASVTVTVGSAILIFLCILILFVTALVVYLNQKKKRKLKPPRYEQHATKTKFYDRATIDAMFISSLPTSNASTKRTLLNDLEDFLTEPKIAYPLLQALAKAGLAREDVSAAIMYIYFFANESRSILNYGVQKEIVGAMEESTLFREDSALAALWQSYVRLVGLPYLWTVCSETLYDIATVSGHNKQGPESLDSINMLRPRSFEVDKNRLKEVDEQFINIIHLKITAQKLFNKIRTTPFPPELKWFLQSISSKTSVNFSELTNGVIANFIFLRFICLGITTPNAFGLWKRQPSPESLRFLVLLSKVLQNLAFGVEFEKEAYMTEMNDFIIQNRDFMNNWLEKISQNDEYEEENNDVYYKVVVNQATRDNCLKWMYSQMITHRQALKRELRKKLDAELWEQAMVDLEKLKIMNGEESSDSTRTGSGTRKGSSGNGSVEREVRTDEDDEFEMKDEKIAEEEEENEEQEL